MTSCCLSRSVHLSRVVAAQRHAVHHGEARGQPARGVHELPDGGRGQCPVDYRRRVSAEPADAHGASLGGQSDGLW